MNLHQKKDPRLLIYCPNTGGHRHLYIWQYCSLVLEFYEEVFVFALGNQLSHELKLFEPHDSAYLRNLKRNDRVHWLADFENDELFHDEAAFIQSLQLHCESDMTLFLDGDILIPEFSRMAAESSKRFLGRNYALFIKLEFLYGEAHSVPGTVPYSEDFYNTFFGRGGLMDRVLDGCLYTDDLFDDLYKGDGRFFVPDVIVSEDAERILSHEVSEAVRDSIRSFLATHSDKQVLLFFGGLERRKGYDFILRYAARNSQTVVLRVGRTNPWFTYGEKSVLDAKEKLTEEGRIMEMECFIEDRSFIEELFVSVEFVLLPYVNFFRTSSLLMDAVFRLKPVLVPDVGLMARYVENYQIGMTFSHRDFSSFEIRLNELIAGFGNYRSALLDFRENLAKKAQLEKLSALIAHATRDEIGESGNSELHLNSQSRDDITKMKDILEKQSKRKLLEFFCDVAERGRTVVFGAGLLAQWLEKNSRRQTPNVVAVVDNQPEPECELWGQKVTLPSRLEKGSFDQVFLATEKFQDEMESSCRRLWGKSVEVFRVADVES